MAAANEQLERGDFSAFDNTLLTTPSAGAYSSRDEHRFALLAHRAGRRALAAARLSNGPPDVALVHAWTKLHLGDDWAAGRAALEEMGRPDAEPREAMKLLWDGLCAVRAGNDAGLDELMQRLGTPFEPLILDLLMRALGARRRFDDVDRIAQDLGARHALPPWMALRIQAEARLEQDDVVLIRDAMAKLEGLLSAMPAVHQAEVLHNLADGHLRLGERAACAEHLRRATRVNPLLEDSRERLESLGEALDAAG